MAKNQRDFFKKKNEWSEIKDTLLDATCPSISKSSLFQGSRFSILIALLAKASLTMEMMAPH